MTENTYYESEHQGTNIPSIMAGMLVGSLAGALTMLLLAPQSGKDTRTQIREKGIELRDRTTALLDESMARVRSSRDKFTQAGHRKAEELVDQGKMLVVEQLDHVAEAAKAGKKAIQGS